MEFGSGFGEDVDDQRMSSTTSSKANSKLPFSYSSSSSPSSSSSHHHQQHHKAGRHHHHQQLVPLDQIYDKNHHPQQQKQQVGSWLGSNYDQESEDNEGAAAAAASKLDIMDVNDEDDDYVRGKDNGGGGGGGGGGDGEPSVVVIEKEHMFDKVVTPSDVGKLNRLVIPKQHAEKYFPLDSSTNDKGLLLNFEDRNGKSWRFRYSYWNSSQSYVMTKGWSRFVKEKKLDAGDIVSFHRGVGEAGKDRLYIDWRRRPDAPDPTSYNHHYYHNQHHHHHFSPIPWSPLLMRPPTPFLPRDHLHLSNSNSNINNSAYYRGATPEIGVGGGGGGCGGGGGGGGSGSGSYYGYGTNYSNAVVKPCSSSGPVYYMRSPQQLQQQQQQQVGLGVVQMHWQQPGVGRGRGVDGGMVGPMVYDSVPVVQGKAAAKRLRLFGVNMDCPINESDECDKFSSSSSPTATMPALQLLPPPPHQSSLQLRLYNGTPIPAMPGTATAHHEFLHKGKSSMSLDLDI